MGENPIVDEAKKNEAVHLKTGASREIVSIIQTEQSGFLVSISRSVKVGRTAAEVSTVKMEGHAKDMAEAAQVIGNLDNMTQQFIKNEAAFYGVNLQGQPTNPSPIENKKE
jgi:hypothetical protein